MKKIRLGINGFGRIGRLFLRSVQNHPQLEVVMINSGSNPQSHAFLFEHDSTYGQYKGTVGSTDHSIIIDGHEILVTKVMDPGQIPWHNAQVDVVVEASGLFTDKETAQKHLQALGVKKVIISAPGKGVDGTFVMGVNEQSYDPTTQHVIANASCTTNCLTPIAYLLNNAYGIKHAVMNTTHSYTSDQNLLDNSHPHDLRRARGAGQNMIPTTTGAALATTEVIPELKGKLNGIAVRVPTATVSLLNLVAELEQGVTKEAINQLFKDASVGFMKQYLAYNELPLVSSDYKGTTYSCIVDGLSTDVVDKTMVSIVAWYDNEWGYTQRLVELTGYVASKL
ncbi:type I glyceraldehyde-3-phosphate dehydrogenase [Candidatus Gracilibacteria bacterium]|nr:type I glyceraldehyde-3-phosphate dehydrogenase [Candidatus Gracilibacteria bacterium]